MRCPLASRCFALATGRVGELPTRKPRKAIPQKQTAMLVVTNSGHILLEQRPAHGIWGGLLSLPEIDAAESAAKIDQYRFEATIARAIAPFGILASCERLPSFSHGFTHFKLDIAPFRIQLRSRLEMAGEPTHVWYGVERLADAPLPAPVKKLLLALFSAIS